MATVTTAPTQAPERREAPERAVRTMAPCVDIYETEKSYVLLADMPGVTPDGLDVVAERDELVVRGRVERPTTTPDYQEFELADYYRAFSLTEDQEARHGDHRQGQRAAAVAERAPGALTLRRARAP